MKKVLEFLYILLVAALIVSLALLLDVPGYIAEALSVSAEQRLSEGDGAGAVSRLRIAVALASGDGELWCSLADGYISEGRAHDAENVLQLALDRTGGNIRVYRRLVRLHTENGEYEEALRLTEKTAAGSAQNELERDRPAAVKASPAEGPYYGDVTVTLGAQADERILIAFDDDPFSVWDGEPLRLGFGTHSFRTAALSGDGLIGRQTEHLYTVTREFTPVTLSGRRIEAQVRGLLDIPEGQLYQNQLYNIRSLTLDVTADAAPVSDLLYSISSLRYLPNLEKLTIVGETRIRSFTVLSELKNLRELSIIGCSLTDEDLDSLASLTALEKLDLSNNQITDVSALSGLWNLRELDLSGNGLTTLEPLTPLFSLEKLSIDRNTLTTLQPLAGLSRLRELSAASNQIDSLEPLKKLTELRTLNVTANNLMDLSGLQGLGNLISLNASNNRVTDIGALAGLMSLREVTLTANGVHNLLPIAGLQLKTLLLASNNVSNLIALTAMDTLEALDLRYNPVWDITVPGGLDSLAQLRLDGCPVLSVAPLAGSRSLRELSCVNCPIADLALLPPSVTVIGPDSGLQAEAGA